MKHHHKAPLSVLAILGLAAVQTAMAVESNLFTALPEAQKSITDDPYLRALGERASNADIQILGLNRSAVETRTQTLLLNMWAPHNMAFTQRNSVTTDDGLVIWEGELDQADTAIEKGTMRGWAAWRPADFIDPENSITLVRNGDMVTGNLRMGGQLYSIRPLSHGRHAFIEVDESRFPADHDPDFDIKTPTVKMPDHSSATKATSTIRVTVGMTNNAINRVADPIGLINLAITETNRGYQNSGVEINLVLAGAYAFNYNESSSSATDVNRWKGTNDGYMDGIHGVRNSNGGDVAVLIEDVRSSCGRAASIGSSASTAFAIVDYSCATGYYSFGHEIGHLQSARHDPANDPTNTPYRYGHGYQYSPGGWRTIMAYNCSGGCTRINYWSNPNRTYGGRAMGTTDRSHNQRALNNTKGTIAGFR